MFNKTYLPNKDKPSSLLNINKNFDSNNTEIPSNSPPNQTNKSWNKFRAHKKKWRLSKLKGYISDEFRNIELTD